MNTNPNLRNPLALFALCLLLIESIAMALLLCKAKNIELSECAVNAFVVFIVAFPVLVFVCFYVLLLRKPETLFSPYENAMAFWIVNMSKGEIQEAQRKKDIIYGSLSAQSRNSESATKTKEEAITEEQLLNQYITKLAPFMMKNVKVATVNGLRFFDGYANWNGYDYVLEVKRLNKWTEASRQGVALFAAKAKSCFSSPHLTILLYIMENIDNQYEEIAKEIHIVAPAINIIFARTSGNSKIIQFSDIY